MSDVVIENPVINSPFSEPQRQFRFSEEGITSEIVEGRRVSAYFVPIARPRSYRPGQLQLPNTEWTQDRLQENTFINRVRERVGLWRRGGYVGITRTTRRLLEHWSNPGRERRLFFCQLEALETVIYLAEVAAKYDPWIEADLRRENEGANPGLFRVACKMATGSGKTVVMAMLIAWQALNKLANPQDARFSDAFLLVTPGITIRDRLRVLLPSDPQNYYRQLDIVPPELREDLERAKIVITNRHAFKRRERLDAAKLTKRILTEGNDARTLESPGQMVRRVCRELGPNKRNIVVINDEAHHCYRRRPETAAAEKLSGDEKAEAEERNAAAWMWISGLEAIKDKLGVKVVYDLSATPFFLRGSGYPEGTLFPWVVSDFSLIDAIEAGIVKVPRVPVADDAHTADALPTYRDLWVHIRDDLPKKGRATDKYEGEPRLPKELEGALWTLYGSYQRYYGQWEQNADARATGLTPPVFIVVCSNTNVSKLVYNFISGWERTFSDIGGDGDGATRTVAVPGRLPLFSNVADGRWLDRPNTLLVDSAQIDSGEGMSNEFKKIAAREIAEFKAEYRQRFPDRDPDALRDEDLLREVMNTVGKAGKLGESIKCVVSVSMLTEGWDANTVTHVLGVRAFSTQLLCEQVVGRALRRMSYVADDDGKFAPEYAEVYGVPFSFIPCAGTAKDPKPSRAATRVRALEDRAACEIAFPRLLGYTYDQPAEQLSVRFTGASRLVLSSADVPLQVEVAPIFGASAIHRLDLQRLRPQEVAFRLARRTLERYYADDGVRAWLFPQLLEITKDWLAECVECEDGAYPQLLLLAELADRAAGRIHLSIAASAPAQASLRPLLRPYDPVGSTAGVDFDTIKPVYPTRADKSHISHVVCDSTWEAQLAETLEDIPEVRCYAKNQGLGFVMPYTLDGEEKSYFPDFLVRLDDGHGPENPLNLIVEVSGAKREDKDVKVWTAQTLWVPAVNNHGGFGRWAFAEITDPALAAYRIRSVVHRPSPVAEQAGP